MGHCCDSKGRSTLNGRLITSVICVLTWTFLLMPATATAEESASNDVIEMRLHWVDTFFPEFPIKREMNRRYRAEIRQLRAKLQTRLLDGDVMNCTAQILDEVHWLVNYTDRKELIEERLHDLRNSFGLPDQSFAARQDPEDGSFGPCYKTWIWRFTASEDPLKELARQGKRPKIPLKIWEPVDTPEEIVAMLDSLLISDNGSGHNKRKELNRLITTLGQLLWYDYTDVVFPEHLDRDQLAAALTQYTDEHWQDSETGYWGAWYRDGDRLHKTQDLSITFHILSYRGGRVNLLDKIAATTFAIRNVKYPYGWDTGGDQNNHHAYDVARIINLTRDHLDATADALAGTHIFLLTTRSLALSIDETGSFDPKPYTTIGEAYYFGISFLIEVGLIGEVDVGESMVVLTNTESLLKEIWQNLLKLDRSDPYVVATLNKLADVGIEVPN